MKRYHQPSGLVRGLEFLIDPYWTPEQAMVVYELLDDLRDLVWSHYEDALRQKIAEDRITCFQTEPSDPPF